jgi:hypothetical protein
MEVEENQLVNKINLNEMDSTQGVNPNDHQNQKNRPKMKSK